ncbi:MAG: DUF2889 domain-containing protein [Porticoccaceae bacterium]|nr:DUF2889 domain-containing protein [Pseudomonadales bacterium]MCP5172086.1 DUF2889 domain-containing protein [Pseudomonadales bacterium]
MNNLLPLPINPTFGTRISRRKVSLKSEPGMVTAQFADIYHEMACILHHDGEKITSLKGEIIRFPTNLCPGAEKFIQELEGTSINTEFKDLYANQRAKRQCTHLFDLAALAIRHSHRSDERIYEAVVPDMDGIVDVSISCNGSLVHQWQILNQQMVSSDELNGKPLIQGFIGWASRYYKNSDELEAAIILSRTIFIARGRRYEVKSGHGDTLNEHKSLLGSCFAYQPERVKSGRYIGVNERNFSDGVAFQPITIKPSF